MGDALEDLERVCYPDFSSLDNSYQQNPCQVAHILFRVCDNSEISRDDYSLSALDVERGQHHYPAPNQWQATECICSMAGYNLVQACAACQQTTPIGAVSWNDWVSNCTMSNINFGKTFPYEIPSSTNLPNWAYANNRYGSFNMADTFGRINNNQSAWPFNPSSYSIATATSTTSFASSSPTPPGGYGQANSEPPSNVPDGDGDADDTGENNTAAKIAVGVVIPIVVIGGILLSILFYIRRKRRTARQRGLRLGSDNNLPPPTFLVDDPSSNPFSDPQHFAASGPDMTQQKGPSQITSLFLPSETVFTRSSHSRSSFTTNSVSTGSVSVEYAQRTLPRHLQGPRLGPDPYGPRDSTSLFAPSTTDYDSRSSAAYTYDDDEDESISPFSDIHRPRPTVLASRNNLHNTSQGRRGASYYSSPSLMSASASETDSMLSGRDADEESVITLSSRISKLSGRAPSSCGATYGGAHDSEDDDDEEDGGFETERYEDEEEGEETEGGYETEQGGGGGFDSETETEVQDDAISLSSTMTSSTAHRP
ncbi:uncharacterized protein JCM6883_006446 [Sporobolomyces salmoneus]|uniref:uncharacterized protein n=1 Tax=Sporobolomyces salmoneus TaxID=183962 RepID=UPI003174C0EE